MKVDVEGEFWRWKLSGCKVVLKVDGVGIRVIGEVGDGVISHQVKIPRLAPIITRMVKINHILLSSPLDGGSPSIAINGDLVQGVVDLNLEVLQNRSTKQKRSITWDHKHLESAEGAANVDGQVDRPF